MQPVVIGVAGGSGSGKSRLVREIRGGLGVPITVLHNDAYYHDCADLSFEERAAINYDHPDSLETSLLIQHVLELLAGRSVEVPVYDFATHLRTPETTPAKPGKVIVVDGILILAEPVLRRLLEIKVYVDTDSDVRLIRRLKRDTAKRGRTMESVLQQYHDTVRPMHLEFVEPSKRYADIIVPEGGDNRVAVDMLVTKIRSVLAS
ncbi:uridine kinase [soil metagenome]